MGELSPLNKKGAHECVCGMGCGRRFPFQSRHECEAQVIESRRGDDACQSHPCLHSGECIALNDGGYHCECTGTGYHGETCHIECPVRMGLNALGLVDSPPLDCLTVWHRSCSCDISISTTNVEIKN